MMDDLRMAALCLKDQAGPRLYKLEKHKLKSRRLDPLHLACTHADPELVEHMGGEYALPLMNYYAGQADRAVTEEVEIMSAWFRMRRMTSVHQLVGVAAATYAAVLGATMRGDEREARATLALLMEATEDIREEPPAAGKRYMLQCAAVADIVERRASELSAHLVKLAPYAAAEREKALSADADAVRTEGLGAPDLAIPALVGLALLVNVEVDLGPLRAVAPGLAELAADVERAWMLVE